jgi:uncharacterized membrane protein YcgQ (UPF0703/DUF1980 family)
VARDLGGGGALACGRANGTSILLDSPDTFPGKASEEQGLIVKNEKLPNCDILIVRLSR